MYYYFLLEYWPNMDSSPVQTPCNSNAKESCRLCHPTSRTIRARHPETKFTRLPKEKVDYCHSSFNIYTCTHCIYLS